MKHALASAILGGILAAVELTAADMELNGLMIEPYRRQLVLESYGIRAAWAVDSTTIAAECGISLSGQYLYPNAYLISSEQDPNYLPSSSIAPLSVKIARIEEAAGFPESVQNPFCRTLLIFKLPRPMTPLSVYSVTAQGLPYGQPLTFGRMSAEFTYGGTMPDYEAAALQGPFNRRVLGLRGIASVGGGIIQVSIGPAINDPLSITTELYQFMLNGAAASPVLIAKRKVVECMVSVIPYVPIERTDLFFQFDRSLRDGDTVSVSIDPSVCSGERNAELKFDSRRTVSPSFFVPKFRFNLSQPSKLVFAGNWISTLPSGLGGVMPTPPLPQVAMTLTLNLPPPLPQFTLWSGEENIQTGTLQSVAAPQNLPGIPEFKLPGIQVYAADISNTAAAEVYYISVPGIGRSLPFHISNQAYAGQLLPRELIYKIGGIGEMKALEGNPVTTEAEYLLNLYGPNPIPTYRPMPAQMESEQTF